MANWIAKINFKGFWDDDSMSVTEKGRAASKVIDSFIKTHKNRFDEDDLSELIEISDAFNHCTGDGLPDGESEFTPTEDFDARMYDLYEWADYNRVWISTTI
jgi:hypothetical protein